MDTIFYNFDIFENLMKKSKVSALILDSRENWHIIQGVWISSRLSLVVPFHFDFEISHSLLRKM